MSECELTRMTEAEQEVVFNTLETILCKERECEGGGKAVRQPTFVVIALQEYENGMRGSVASFDPNAIKHLPEEAKEGAPLIRDASMATIGAMLIRKDLHDCVEKTAITAESIRIGAGYCAAEVGK